MENLLNEIRTSFARIYSPSITTKILIEEELQLAKISTQPEFPQLFIFIISNQQLVNDKYIFLWATREFHKLIRSNYSILSPDLINSTLGLIFTVLSENKILAEQPQNVERLLEIFLILFSKIFSTEKNSMSKIFEVLGPRNFYKFLSLFPIIANDKGIVIDDINRIEFGDYFLFEVIPPFLKSNYFALNVINNTDSLVICNALSFYNNLLLYILEQKQIHPTEELNSVLSVALSQELLNFAFGALFDVITSEDAYDMIMQMIRTVSGLESDTVFLIPVFDSFIDNCFQLMQTKSKTLHQADITILLKVVSKLFQTFPEKLTNVEKAVYFLLEFLVRDCESINSLLLGFKKFLKKVCFSETRLNFVNLVNLLWRKLPALIELTSKEFKENEKMQTDNDYHVDLDESIYDFKHVRRNVRSLAKYLIYFLPNSDLLVVLQSELIKIVRDFNSIRAIESFSYLFTSIFMLVNERKFKDPQLAHIRRLDVIQQNISHPQVFTVIMDIYSKLFTLLSSEWSVQVKINVLQMTHHTLPYFNSISPFVDRDYFNTLRFLIESSSINRPRKYEKYLFLALEKYFSIIPQDILISNFEFISKLLFSEKINTHIFNEIIHKISIYCGENSVFEVTNKLIHEIKTNLVPNSHFEETGCFLMKLKAICETSSEMQINTLVFPIIECVQFVTESFFSNDHLCENNCQLVFAIFKRVSQTSFGDVFLKSPELSTYLSKIVLFFNQTYIPSYIYILETLTHRFYKNEHFLFFQELFEKVTTIISNLVEPENWDGHFIVSNGVRVKFSEKFSFLFDQNGLQIEDVFDDFYGFLTLCINQNHSFFNESPNQRRITRMVFNTFDNYFIYNIKTLLNVFFAILGATKPDLSSEESVFWSNFWLAVIERAICLIFEESLLERQVRKLIKLVAKIHKAFQIQTIEQIKILVHLISPTVLTDNEKNEFLWLIVHGVDGRGADKQDKLSIFTKKLIGRIREFRKNAVE